MPSVAALNGWSELSESVISSAMMFCCLTFYLLFSLSVWSVAHKFGSELNIRHKNPSKVIFDARLEKLMRYALELSPGNQLPND